MKFSRFDRVVITKRFTRNVATRMYSGYNGEIHEIKSGMARVKLEATNVVTIVDVPLDCLVHR